MDISRVATKVLVIIVIRNLFKIYNPVKINIVMLGNSITWGVNWNELLSRTDVANRGIPCEKTEDFLYRLDDIYKLKPKICFIMGGGK